MEQRSKSHKSYYNMSESRAHADLIRRVSYNPETGEVTSRVNAATNRQIGRSLVTVQNRGKKSHPRPVVNLSGISYLAHRLCWFYVHGKWPEGWLVPLDGDRSNLRIANWKLIPGDVANLRESGRLARERQMARASAGESSE